MRQDVLNNEPKDKYSMFPNFLVDNGVLAVMTPVETKIYLTISRGCSNKRKICRYSIKTISDKSNIWIGTVYNAIKGLDDLKVIKTWVHKLENGKIRVKRYFQLTWESYSLAEVFKRQEIQKEKRERIIEKHTASITKAREKKAENQKARKELSNSMSGSNSNIGKKEDLRVSI